MPRDGLLSGKMIMAQVSYCQNKRKRLTIAQKFIEGAVANMLRNLNYYDRRGKDLGLLIKRISIFAEEIQNTNDIDELMGLEGNIRMAYYDAFDLILNDFQMDGRSKQPPRNEVNAMISFGKMMCYTQCLRAIHQTQLNPTISYLHTSGERRYSLCLDVSEIFKPILVDRIIFKVLNKREIQEKHFDSKLNCCLLNENGRKIFVKNFEEKMNETIYHRQLGRSVSYKYLIKLECYKLCKHILGIEEYKPLKMWW